LAFLKKEAVETKFIARKEGHRTSAVALGIEPPDRFPLVYYRDNCADIELTIDDVIASPVTDCKVFQFAGTNLSKEPSRSATFFAAEMARSAGTEVVFDIDFRPDQWHDPRAFGVMARAIMPLVDIVIGTEDEINAAMLSDASQITLTHSQVSDTKVDGDVHAGMNHLMSLGPKVLLQKLGADGLCIHLKQDNGSVERVECPGFPVEVQNILGAGDAFAAGFLAGHVTGRGWYEAGRMATACGAIVVTKHGCANFMPTDTELFEFIDGHGGF
jgi:5-dehydro-2-deoxygluconokinase